MQTSGQALNNKMNTPSQNTQNPYLHAGTVQARKIIDQIFRNYLQHCYYFLKPFSDINSTSMENLKQVGSS